MKTRSGTVEFVPKQKRKKRRKKRKTTLPPEKSIHSELDERSQDVSEATAMEGGQKLCVVYEKKKKTRKRSLSEISEKPDGREAEESNGQLHDVLHSPKSVKYRKKSRKAFDEELECSSSLPRVKAENPCSTSRTLFSSSNSASDQKRGSRAAACRCSTNFIRRSTRLRHSGSKIQRKAKFVSIDEEDSPPGRKFNFEKGDCRCGTKIYYPPKGPEAVMISYSDMKCLAPSSYLSSPIMNFYIQYIQVRQCHRKRVDYYIFNTYFYRKLDETISHEGESKRKLFMKLRRWCKGSIYEKSYIFLPIHLGCHWSLGIICFPPKESDQGAIILHMDSLGTHPSSSIFKNIRSYLEQEWKGVKDGMTLPDLPSRTRFQKIKVPQQQNSYDCGLFVLKFIERFLEDAPERLRIEDTPQLFGEKWFDPEDAFLLRQQIKSYLCDLFDKAAASKQ